MILDFDKIEEQVIPNFKGGEKQFHTHSLRNESDGVIEFYAVVSEQ